MTNKSFLFKIYNLLNLVYTNKHRIETIEDKEIDKNGQIIVNTILNETN